MTRRIVFIERDGGLYERTSGSDDEATADLRLARHLVPALLKLATAGYEFVVLNDNIESQTHPKWLQDSGKLDALVERLLFSQGIEIAASQTCRHVTTDQCDCALPGLGLIRSYVSGNELDRNESVVVGSGGAIREFAANVGVRSFVLDPTANPPVDWLEVAHLILDRPRIAQLDRKTRETEISVRVDLDQAKSPQISTGIGFFDHMLEQIGKHGEFSLFINCQGDLHVDEHHTIEDVAICLGQALRQALRDKRGIQRYGFVLPMDEARAEVSLDLGGRAYLVFTADFPRNEVGGMPTELVEHFFRSLADALGATLNISVSGENTHHMIEACFKGVAKALRQAIRLEGDTVPSTKGIL